MKYSRAKSFEERVANLQKAGVFTELQARTYLAFHADAEKLRKQRGGLR